jgi:hypothetical protein
MAGGLDRYYLLCRWRRQRLYREVPVTNPTTPRITEVTPAMWEQAWKTRACLNCGNRTERNLHCHRDSYACDPAKGCGLVVWYDFDYTDAGRAVANGYGWAGAPFSDGTYPKLRENERYGCFYAEPRTPYTGEGVPF